MIDETQLLNRLPQGIAHCVVKNKADINFETIDIVYYNRTFAIYFNLPEVVEKPLNHVSFSHISKSGKDRFEETAKEVIENQQLQQFIYYSHSLDSQFQIVYTPIDETSFLVTVNDVTIQFLNASEKEIILSSLNNMIFVFDQEFKYKNIYVADESVLFLPINEVLNKKMEDMFPSDFTDTMIASFKKAKETNDTVSITVESPMPFDSRIYTYQQQYLIINNQPRYVSTVVDVTEEVNLRRELEAQTQQLEKFFTVNLDLLCIIDHNGYFIRVNKIWEEVLGYELDEIHMRSVFDLIHPDDIEATQRQIDRLSNKEEVTLFTNRYRTKDGTYRFFEWRATASDDVIYAAARDITEQKDVEQQLGFQKEQFEMAIEGSQEGIFDWDIKNETLFFSKRWKSMLGYEDDELKNKFDTFADLLYEDDVDYVMKKITRFFDGLDQEYDIEFRMKHKNGHLVWIRARAQAQKDESGTITRIAGSHSDITKAKENSHQLEEAYLRLNQMAEYGRIITWEIDVQGKYTYVSPMSKRILGYEDDEVIGKYFYDFHPEQGRQNFIERAMKEISSGQKIRDFENPMVSKDNTIIWMLTNAVPTYSKDGVLLGYRGSDQDITVMKESQKALEESEEKYRLLTENLSDVLWIYNLADDKYIYFSNSVKNLTGFDRNDLYDKGIQDIIDSYSYQKLFAIIQKTLPIFKGDPTQQDPNLCDIQIVRNDGSLNWVELSFTYRYNENQEVEVIGVGRDIEDRKQVEQQLHYLSFHDTLTGLYNRAYYEEELKRLNVSRNLPISIIMADINDLKLTNDTFGHLEGDKLIQSFANVLKEATREDDILARIGGDEFVVLLPQTNEEEVQQIVDRVKTSVVSQIPSKLKLSAAIGHMTTHEIIDSHDEVFKKAEDAMYKHKLRDKLSQDAETINIISQSFKEKYKYYYDLCHMMVPYVLKIASFQHLPKKQRDDLENATRFALVGLLSDENISLKQDAYRIAQHGYHILKNVPSFRDVADIVLALFENVDGSGLPHQLTESDIPYPSQIIRVVLDYCHYKKQELNFQDIENLMRDKINRIYDEKIFEVAISVLGEMDNEKL